MTSESDIRERLRTMARDAQALHQDYVRAHTKLTESAIKLAQVISQSKSLSVFAGQEADVKEGQVWLIGDYFILVNNVPSGEPNDYDVIAITDGVTGEKRSCFRSEFSQNGYYLFDM